MSDPRAEVGCAGILVADTFCGPMDALPPAGRLLSLDDMPSRPGGCAANVAIDLAKQGVRVDVAGRVGRDGGANLITTAFAKHGIGCGRIAASDEQPTSTTVILLIRGEDRRYLHCFGANGAFTAADLPREWLAGLKVFYLGGLLALPGLRTNELLDALRFCRANGVTTVVDVVVPQGARDAMQNVLPLLPEIDYILPNDDEAAELTGTTDPLGQVRTLLSCGAGNVIVTRGAEGAVAGSRASDTFWRIGAYSDEAVIDPSGAGDAFASGVVTGILRGWEMDQTLRYAAALGASATRAVGTTDGVFTAAEAERFIAEHPLPVACESLSGSRVASSAGVVKAR